MSSFKAKKVRVTIAELVTHGKLATRAGIDGRMARAKLRHAVLTKLPDQIVGGALLRNHLKQSIEIRKIELKVANWPAKFDGIRVGHISDFAALGQLRASMGRFFVLGNHDLLDNEQRVMRLARESGMTTLRGETLTARGGLRIGGIDWSRTLAGNAQEVRKIVQEGNVPHLLLAHNPKAFREAAKCNVPLTLSGHTHGGQFALLPSLRKKPRAIRICL